MKRLFAYALASLLSLGALNTLAAGTDDLLSPDQAFKPSLQKKDDHTVVVHMDIAEGYYLYRDRMHFTLQPGDGELKPAFPEGLVHHDDYFGDVMTYRHTVDVPLTSAAAIAPDAKVKVVAQGCADAGVCYPPQTTLLNASGSAAASSSVSAKVAALLGDVKSAPSSATTAKPTDAPASKHAEPAPAPTAPATTAPVNKVETKQTVAADKPAAAPAKAEVDAPTALPAKTSPTPEAAAPAVVAASTPASTTATPPTVDSPATAPTRPAGPFDGLSGPMLLLAFYLAGLGMAATVCMYPLIPIVSSLIVGAGGQQSSKTRGFVLSLAYVQGIGFVYAIVGAVAALSGSFLIAQLQQPWVIACMALLFVVLALSMFGLFTLQLPSALQSRVNDASNRLGGGKLIPVFIMGALSSLIVGACMGPPLFAALSVVGSKANLLLGIVGFYLMAMGVGTPLVVVGVAGGHVLPKAGLWMTQVKNVFGVIMLGVALWIGHPVLPDWAFMLCWGLLAIGCGVALSALDALPAHVKTSQRLAKALGVVLLLVGAGQIIGLLSGSRNPLQPLRSIAVTQASGSTVVAAGGLNFQPVTSPSQLDAAIAQAHGKPVMLDFYADWCVSCREMEHNTFSDPRVQQQLAKFVLLKADVTRNTTDQQALLKRFGLFGPPGTIFFGAGGKEAGSRLIGFEAAEAFIQRTAKL